MPLSTGGMPNSYQLGPIKYVSFGSITHNGVLIPKQSGLRFKIRKVWMNLQLAAADTMHYWFVHVYMDDLNGALWSNDYNMYCKGATGNNDKSHVMYEFENMITKVNQDVIAVYDGAGNTKQSAGCIIEYQEVLPVVGAYPGC